MRNLAPDVRGGKHERSRRRDPNSQEPQTAGHRSPVRGRRVSDHPDRRSRAEGRRCLYRHAQRAGRLLRGAGLRLSDRPPRRLHRCDRPRRGARSRRPRQCPAKLLANDPVWRCLGDLSRRHGRIPGRAPGADCLAVLQIRARHRERPAHPLLCRDGNAKRDLWPPRRYLSRCARRHHHRQMRRRQSRPGRACARPAAHGGADGEHRGGAESAPTGRAAARSHRQGHGLVPRRERSPRLRRAHPTAVPAFADGQGRDAGRPSAVGGGGAHAGAPERRRRLLMGARFNWIFHFGQPPRYAKDVKVIQLDISPEEIGHNKATEVALVGDGKAIVGQLNQALAARQWFYPKDTPWRQMITKKADENAAQIRPQIHDDEAPANYFRALRDVAAWLPENAILSAEGAGTMDIGLTQLPSFSARSCLNAGTYGTMGVGLGHAIAACVVHPDRPVIHLSGDSAIGFSGMEMETLVRYNFPAKIVVLNNGGIGPGMPEVPESPMFNLKPNALIYGARYDRVMEAFGGRGLFVEDPKHIRRALDEAMEFPGPALVNVVLSQGSTRKAQQFAWHS